MPALSPNGKPFSQTNQVNDLRPTDFVPMVRLSEPDPANQNVIIRGDRLTALLGTPGSVPPGPSLPLYGGPGSHTDGPMTQTAATDYANRGPNLRPDLAKSVRHYTRANNPYFDPAGDTALDELPAIFLALGTTCRVDFGAAGTGPDHLELVYDAAPVQAVPLHAFRDGTFGQQGGAGLPVKWVPANSPMAFAPAYASLPTGFPFTVGFVIRAYVPVNGSPAEEFFKARFAGAWAAPTDATGGANWEPISPADVALPSVSKAYVDDANAAQDATTAALQTSLGDKADLVNGTVPAAQLPPPPAAAKLYTATGTATDGAMDQNATTIALGLKANKLTSLDYLNEATLYDGDSAVGFGRSFRLTGGTVGVYGTTAPSAGFNGRVNLFGNGSSVPTTLTVAQNVTTTFDGATTLVVNPGEWVLLRYSDDKHSIRMRGLLTAPGTGGGTAPSTGIDYANPITLNAVATLTANKAYYATGSGYKLTLPDAAINIGAAIFVSIAATATGLYPLAGTNVTLYAAESMLVRATADGWKKTGGELLAMSARLQTTPATQTNLPAGGFNVVPFPVVGRNNALPTLASAALGQFVVQRDGMAVVTLSVPLKNTTLNGQYYTVIAATPPGSNETTLVAAYAVTIFNGYGVGSVTVTAPFVAGTILRAKIYCGQSADLLGGNEDNIASFTFTELL